MSTTETIEFTVNPGVGPAIAALARGFSDEPSEYVELLFRLLASLPGGEDLADLGYAPFETFRWDGVERLGHLLSTLTDRDDVEATTVVLAGTLGPVYQVDVRHDKKSGMDKIKVTYEQEADENPTRARGTTPSEATEFSLRIELGNDQMRRGRHIAEALRALAERVEAVGILQPDEGKIRDANGNTVGSWGLR